VFVFHHSMQLVARDLFQSFQMGKRRIEVLRGISLDVGHGEVVFICGASGAGKTTLMYTLAGLERPESGTVEFEGRNLYNGSSAAQARFRNRKMGFVFQGYFLLPELTALENVSLPSLIGGRSTTKAGEESLRAVGLADRMQHLPAELSGGEQQRVALARAVVNRPAIVLADEPTGNLDTENSALVLKMFRELNDRFNQTIIMITHNPEAAAACQRIIQMRDGHIV
jgi:ABC-type lipoprotein export system ATPase subunit